MTQPAAPQPAAPQSAAARSAHQPSATQHASPFSQSKYQVRFEWSGAGARAITDGVDVVVWVDALDSAAPGGATTDAAPDDVASIIEAAGAPDDSTPVILGGFANRTALARWVLALQTTKGDRVTIAVVAAGGIHHDGSPRVTVEDLLAAGAVIDALAAGGIDYCSPEAAAASAAFSGLRSATSHLSRASGTGQQLILAGRRAEIAPAVTLDATEHVVDLRQQRYGGAQEEFSPRS